MIAYLWVALGGALGSVGRYWLNGLVSAKFGESFPAGTLVINVGGSFIIGVLAALTMAGGALSADARHFTRQFLMIGLCGGFTTFSAFSLQTLDLIRDRQWIYAGSNVLLSVVLCLVAVWLGFLAGSAINAMNK